MYDVAIIGGGPIGIFSIFSCGLEGLSCAILDSNSALGGQCKFLYSAKNIYDIPGHKAITGGELIDNLIDQISILKYDAFLNSFVSSIDEVDDYFVIKTKSSVIHAKSVIIALGAGIYQPVKLSIPFDLHLEHTKILYSIDDINKFCDKEVSILGGGDTALDFVLDISKVAKKVHLIHRRDFFRSNQISYSAISDINNIEKHTPYFAKSIEMHDDRMVINGNYNIFSDYIIPCYGSASNISFLNEWNLNLKGSKILVDAASMATSRKGIYSIGDCVHYPGKRNLIVTGFSECMVASRAIFNYIYPDKAFNVNYSTNLDIFK